MTITIEGRRIRTVTIVDDQEDARETMRDELELGGLIGQPLHGPFCEWEPFVDSVTKDAQAAVCDHRLHNYAPRNGAELVCRLYGQRFPAVLVTTWSRSDIDQLCRYRRWLPVLLKADEGADFEKLVKGWEVCLREFKEDFLPTRRPWRSMVRIEEVDRQQKPAIVYAVVPGWDSREKVRFPISLIPDALHDRVQTGARLFAMVNKGAEEPSDLYFADFESPE